MNNRPVSKTIVHTGIAMLGVALAGGAILYLFKNRIFRPFYAPAETKIEQGAAEEKTEPKDIEVIAENLAVPWEIAFLPAAPELQRGEPDGDLLVTERPGTLKRIGKEGRTHAIEGVEHVGEGGLLGMALHPRFPENRWLYLYLTTAADSGLKNRVERYRLEDDRLAEKKVIIDNIPGAAYHDGGRMAFAPTFAPNGAAAKPDYHLYITTGDAGNPQLAQNINSLAGKILRLRDDGSIPADNPFANAVYSYGHRNPQGLAWDNKGQLWATEHGRSGILSGLDELNRIEKGKNYGWPVIQGDEKREGMESPIAQSGTDKTWAPAGIVFLNNSLFFGGLRGEALYEAKIISEKRVSLKIHVESEFGRIRTVVLGRDRFLYISTSNTDGRGEPRPGDDKIIRINPKVFQEN